MDVFSNTVLYSLRFQITYFYIVSITLPNWNEDFVTYGMAKVVLMIMSILHYTYICHTFLSSIHI